MRKNTTNASDAKATKATKSSTVTTKKVAKPKAQPKEEPKAKAKAEPKAKAKKVETEAVEVKKPKKAKVAVPETKMSFDMSAVEKKAYNNIFKNGRLVAKRTESDERTVLMYYVRIILAVLNRCPHADDYQDTFKEWGFKDCAETTDYPYFDEYFLPLGFTAGNNRYFFPVTMEGKWLAPRRFEYTATVGDIKKRKATAEEKKEDVFSELTMNLETFKEMMSKQRTKIEARIADNDRIVAEKAKEAKEEPKSQKKPSKKAETVKADPKKESPKKKAVVKEEPKKEVAKKAEPKKATPKKAVKETKPQVNAKSAKTAGKKVAK